MSTRSSRRAKRSTRNNAAATSQNAPQALPSAAPETIAPSASAPSATLLDRNVAATPTEASSSSTRRTSAQQSKSSKDRVLKPTLRGTQTASAYNQAPEAENARLGSELSPQMWRILACAILLIAASLRLWRLDFVPFHHDEGVNGNFLDTLFHKGEYKYNPGNFHGPTPLLFRARHVLSQHVFFWASRVSTKLRYA